MTREEAIKWFKENPFMHKDHEPFQMAIEALEKEPCEDAISRQAVLDLIADYDLSMGQVVKGVHALPPVTPLSKGHRWIPVSERLPEEREWMGTKRFGTTISDEVYVTFETPDGERFTKHLSFQNGGLSKTDQERMRVCFKGAVPIAWMELPKPYEKGGEQE